MTNACLLKYILHGGDIDITKYSVLYFKTMSAVDTAFGTVMTFAVHSTSNQHSWSYMACTHCITSSTSNSLVPTCSKPVIIFAFRLRLGKYFAIATRLRHERAKNRVLFPVCLFCEASKEAQTLTQALLQILPQTTQGLKRSRLEGHPLDPTRTDIDNEVIPVIPLYAFTFWQGTNLVLIKNS